MTNLTLGTPLHTSCGILVLLVASCSFVSCSMARAGFGFPMASQDGPCLFDFEMSSKCMKFWVFVPFMVKAWSVVLAGSGMIFPN